MSQDNWARPRDAYRGSGCAEGFMLLNLLEEYALRKYGRRPGSPA